MKKYFKRFTLCIRVLVIVFIVVFSLFVLLQRVSNNNVSILGYRMFAVATGSMEPIYHVGDVILVKSVDTNTLKIGDDITYQGLEASFKDKVITHRIKDIIEKDGKKSFLAQGVATNTVDPLVSSSQIYGKVSKRLVLFSFFHGFTSKPSGFFILIVLPLMLLIGSEIVQSMLEQASKKKSLVTDGDGGISSGNSEKDALLKELNDLKVQQLQQNLESLQQQVAANQTQNIQNVNTEQVSVDSGVVNQNNNQ